MLMYARIAFFLSWHAAKSIYSMNLTLKSTPNQHSIKILIKLTMWLGVTLLFLKFLHYWLIQFCAWFFSSACLVLGTRQRGGCPSHPVQSCHHSIIPCIRSNLSWIRWSYLISIMFGVTNEGSIKDIEIWKFSIMATKVLLVDSWTKIII